MGDPKLVDRDWRINDAFQDEALVMNSQFVLPIITKYAMSDPGITATGKQRINIHKYMYKLNWMILSEIHLILGLPY